MKTVTPDGAPVMRQTHLHVQFTLIISTKALEESPSNARIFTLRRLKLEIFINI